MSRTRQTDYAGAVGRLSLRDLERLDRRRFAVQPKIDGQYVRVTLDDRGRIRHLISRTGRVLAAGDLAGAFIGWPRSEVVGELESHTEAGTRWADSRGWRAVHLFDAIRAGGEYLGRRPYSERYAALHRMRAEVEQLVRDRPWIDDARGDAHDLRSGRYCRRVPKGWRRAPIVPKHSLSDVDELWHDVERGELEGLVVCALDAPIGARRAKRKVKPTDTIDATVIDADARSAVLEFGGQIFAVGRGRHDLRSGQRVEVAHDGWYERDATPRFARIVRVRHDLGRAPRYP